MNNIRKIIEERLENARNDYENNLDEHCLEEEKFSKLYTLQGQIEAYQDCLNLIDECVPKIVTKQLSIKEIETLFENFNNSQLGVRSSQELSYYATNSKRTEQEILKDFEKLGWKVTQNDDSCMIICFNGFARIVILKCAKRYSINNLCNMQEHKLLNELFEVWQWD